MCLTFDEHDANICHYVKSVVLHSWSVDEYGDVLSGRNCLWIKPKKYIYCSTTIGGLEKFSTQPCEMYANVVLSIASNGRVL